MAQQYDPLEIIVVDGHSDDASAAIAASYPAVTIVSQEGLGLAAAWNQAVTRASGDLIAFLSHDDRWRPGKLARQVAYLEQHPETSLVHTWFRFVLQPGHSRPPGFRPELLARVQKGRLMETLMARREAFVTSGLLENRYAVAPDMDWFARTNDLGLGSAMIPEVFLDKGVHAANTMNNIPVNNANLLSLLRASVSRKRGDEVTP